MGAGVGVANGTEVVVQVPIDHVLECLVAIIANLQILSNLLNKLLKVALGCNKLTDRLNFT
jgi:hypothetical protein